MAKLRFFKPKLAYRMRRRVQRGERIDFDWLTERVRAVCLRGTRSEILLIRFDSSGIETVAFHTADPNDLSDDARRIHQVVSRCHREATGARAPWLRDRYEATPVHDVEVLLRILQGLLLDAGPDGERPTVLVGGCWAFATWELDTLGASLIRLGLDPGRVEQWVDEVAAADVELGHQVVLVNGETHTVGERSRRHPWTDWDVEDGSAARIAYEEEEADACVAYRASAANWRRGVAAAQVPPEMMPSHLLRTGLETVRLPVPQVVDDDEAAADAVAAQERSPPAAHGDRGTRTEPDALG